MIIKPVLYRETVTRVEYCWALLGKAAQQLLALQKLVTKRKTSKQKVEIHFMVQTGRWV